MFDSEHTSQKENTKAGCAVSLSAIRYRLVETLSSSSKVRFRIGYCLQSL